MRPAFYLDDAWRAPELRRLVADGARAESMEPIFPSVTYPCHATLVTGVLPAVHGISSNHVLDAEHGPLPAWNWGACGLRVPALWDGARAAGLGTGAFSWPVTVGAPIDVLIPEIFQVAGGTETTEQLVRRHSTPGLLDAIELMRGQPVFPRGHREWDEWVPRVAGLALDRYQARLVLVHLLTMDGVQHREGPDSQEAREALIFVDRQVGRLVRLLDRRRDTLLVLGDHGFQACRRLLAPNRLFADRGWLEARDGRIQSWKVVAQVDGGAAAVFCKEPALESEVLALLRAQAPGRWSVLDRRRLDDLQTMPGALCALAAVEGVAMRVEATAGFDEKLSRTRGQHGHLPALVPAGFIAWGRGVEPGRTLGRIRLVDVAPTVADLLGLRRGAGVGQPLVLGGRR